MDEVQSRANLEKICSVLACIFLVSLSCNSVTSAEGIPGARAERLPDGDVPSSGSSSNNGNGNGNLPRSPTAESCSASHSHGVDRPLMILSTVDGKLTALDIQNAGQQQWSMDAGIGPLLSSSISQFEIAGPEGTYKVIPSLNGGLFKWDGETLEAVPFTAETLLSTSFKLNDENVMVGGKEIHTFGINARTGELHYICGSKGCQLFGDEATDDQDIIVVQHTRQTVRAVDLRNGSEKWNFSIGQHDVDFLEGKRPSRDDILREEEEEEEVVCETEDFRDSEWEDDVPDVKVDMAAKTVFALGGANGKQILWTHQLESCIASAWTIQDGLVTRVDLFDRASLGLTSDLEPQMTPFIPDFSGPMLYVGNHNDQLYVQPSPGTQHEVSQAAWAAHRGDASAEDGGLITPRVRWRPYAYNSVSRTPSLIEAQNRENQNAASKEKGEQTHEMSVWNQYPFDSGYYVLHHLSPLERSERKTILESNESEDVGLEILFRVSVWTWWQEILMTSVLIAIGMQLFYNYVLKPRRKKQSQLEQQDESMGDPEQVAQPKAASQGPTAASESSAVDYQSRYLTDFDHMECLGKGGFGIVFEAQNKLDQNGYAIKRITLPNREEARDKVLREARTLARLDHSGIVRYFNSWFEEPPSGWQENQDKQFVGESHTSNELLSTMDTPAFFNKNSELIRNREQLLQQTGGKTSAYHGFEPCRKPRFSLSEDEESDDSHGSHGRNRVNDKGDNKGPGVESDILFPGKVEELSGGFHLESDLDESGSFSIVFQGADDDISNAHSVSNISQATDTTPMNMSGLDDDQSLSNQSTDSSLNTTLPFQRYGNGFSNGATFDRHESVDIVFEEDSQYNEHFGTQNGANNNAIEMDKSESFQIMFEDSGCSDHPKGSGHTTPSTHSETSGSNLSRTSSNTHQGEANGDGDIRNKSELESSHDAVLLAEGRCPGTVTRVPKIYLYIQMQLCRKETLKDWLSTNTLSRDRNKVLHIFSQILEAVSYVHGCGMIHRDLKPSNIFFSLDGKVKVGDFGLVTAIDTGMEGEEEEEEELSGLPHHTGRVGTQLYMSPEQVSGQNYDHKVDIFSLGLIFFELFHPFSTEMERIKVMCQAKKRDFPRRFKKELPIEAKFARWLLSDDPDKRPGSEDINESNMCTELYEDYVPPSTHNLRIRGLSNSSR